MANTYLIATIDIGSGRTANFAIRSDVATYFGITTTADGVESINRRRKAHTRARYDGLTDTTKTSTNVSASEWTTVSKASGRGVGKAVKVPTKLENSKKTGFRYVTIRFPQNAVIGAISEFLYTKCTAAKRPAFFISESGAKYPVVNITGDVNPGETEAPGAAPPPAGT